MEIALGLLSVAEKLYDLRGCIYKATKERRGEIADYFDSISNCLNSVYGELVNDRYPGGRCAELGAYAEMLPATIGNYIGAIKAAELSEELHRCHEVEGILGEIRNYPERKSDLSSIDEASGKLRALSVSVRAGYQIE